MNETNRSSPRPRPLSPHLQIYRPQITSVLSILHRATGMALAFGGFLLTLWLMAIAFYSPVWDVFFNVMNSMVGRIILMGLSWCLAFHFYAGIRHLRWDSVKGMDLPSVYRSGYLVIALSTITTLVIWIYGFYQYSLR